ncbi:MAG: metallophosphoesterase [Planctomycetota bacterium]|nr:metallophosphoesterase [Planctomycetota bacterium]
MQCDHPASRDPKSAAAPFRSPDPVQRFRIHRPNLPEALQGFTILHITDLHVRRMRDRFRWLLRVAPRVRPDLIALTGDLMEQPGDERNAIRYFDRLTAAWRPRIGAFGVFGNHDSGPLRAIARERDAVRWFDDAVHDLPGVPLRILASGWPEDWTAVALAEQESGPPPADPTLRLALGHHPCALAAALLVRPDIALFGHTHGGQIRMPNHAAPLTSSALPSSHAAGVMQMGSTHVCITRGIGDGTVELRHNCPPQVALYELRRGPLPLEPVGRLPRVVVRW